MRILKKTSRSHIQWINSPTIILPIALPLVTFELRKLHADANLPVYFFPIHVLNDKSTSTLIKSDCQG